MLIDHSIKNADLDKPLCNNSGYSHLRLIFSSGLNKGCMHARSALNLIMTFDRGDLHLCVSKSNLVFYFYENAPRMA